MAVNCVWCGKKIDDVLGQATMDTCDECEEFFEEHIDDIAKSLDEKKAWISYSLITAIHMLSSKPCIEFKDSKYKDILSE